MRRAGLALVAVALSFLTVPAWANHSMPTGVNCSDFVYQEDAQAYFDQHPGDQKVSTGHPGRSSPEPQALHAKAFLGEGWRLRPAQRRQQCRRRRPLLRQ